MEDNKQKLIQEIKNRIKFLTLEENENKINFDEVGFLVSLLAIYEPPEETLSNEESLKRFWKYVELYYKEGVKNGKGNL